MNLENLHHVIGVPTYGEFILLHDVQSIWVMTYQNRMKLIKAFTCPIRELQLTRIAINVQETILYASGGCKNNGVYIVCWSYQTQMVLRVIRKQFSFPHEGDLLTSIRGDHLFRCNKNCVDIFNTISGERFQQITMRKPRHMIERTQFLSNFFKKDCFCLATNHGNFYVYDFDQRYKLIYEFDSEKRSIYHIVYEC